MDSEGLLILTNDGAFCHRVISPKSGIMKEYRIQVSHPFPQGAEQRFREGIKLDDGSLCLPAELIPDSDRMGAIVRIREGKYHQVKRMVLAEGTRVRYLKRISIGGLRLDEDLASGQAAAADCGTLAICTIKCCQLWLLGELRNKRNCAKIRSIFQAEK